MLGRRTVAIVRPPGDSFVRAQSRHPERDRIDPERARAQHAAYCRLLEAAGVEVLELVPDEAHPDACFTQDPAIVLEDRALLGRFGALSRRGEEEAMADVLSSLLPLIDAVHPPGTLEGGDLLRVGRRIVVGRSRRTNDAGIEALRCFAEPRGWEVCTAEVPAWALHLQTAASGVGDRVVLGPEEVVTQPAFDGLDRVVVPEGDRGAGNVLTISRAGLGQPGFVIAAGSHPVHRELEARGFEVHATALEEFERADGSPTCLSLLVEAPPSVPDSPGPDGGNLRR
ncbi:MAG TPA: arginine deiminase family protein [Actinomycetota bacterium]|nr:arginine deiminase family protein [Actinomycetota bacterium]